MCCMSLQHLKKLNNFNSYLSILSALDSAPLRRLDWQRSTSEVGSGCCIIKNTSLFYFNDSSPFQVFILLLFESEVLIQFSVFQTLEEYSSLIDSSSSFRAYRAALAEVEPPCIPYL